MYTYLYIYIYTHNCKYNIAPPVGVRTFVPRPLLVDLHAMRRGRRMGGIRWASGDTPLGGIWVYVYIWLPCAPSDVCIRSNASLGVAVVVTALSVALSCASWRHAPAGLA